MSVRTRHTRSGVRTAIAIILLAIMLFPVYWMLNISLQSTGGTLATSFFPTHPSLEGYRAALHDQGGNLVTSLTIAVGTVALTLLIATPCAYALAQFRFRWISWALLAILISQMIPGIVIANGLYPVYEAIGLLNSIPGLIIANAASGVPFGILIMRSFMLGIPPSLVEAARVDGAGLVQGSGRDAGPVAQELADPLGDGGVHAVGVDGGDLGLDLFVDVLAPDQDADLAGGSGSCGHGDLLS